MLIRLELYRASPCYDEPEFVGKVSSIIGYRASLLGEVWRCDLMVCGVESETRQQHLGIILRSVRYICLHDLTRHTLYLLRMLSLNIVDLNSDSAFVTFDNESNQTSGRCHRALASISMQCFPSSSMLHPESITCFRCEDYRECSFL